MEPARGGAQKLDAIDPGEFLQGPAMIRNGLPPSLSSLVPDLAFVALVLQMQLCLSFRRVPPLFTHCA